MIPKLTNSTEAVNFWAEKAAEWGELLEHLDDVLPTIVNGELPFGEDTEKALREELSGINLAAATVLGYYSANVWVETRDSGRLVPRNQHTYPNGNGYQPRY